MAELNSNPDFLRRQAEREERANEREHRIRTLERPVLDSLRARGFDAPSITDAVKMYSPLSNEIVDVFLDSVNKTADVKLLETLIRGLGAAARSFDGRPLVRCYESCHDDNLQWVITNTIALARPHSIDDWMEKFLRDPSREKIFRELSSDNDK